MRAASTSLVEHADPDSQTVVDTFRRQATRGQQLTVHDEGRATISVAHVDAAARLRLRAAMWTAPRAEVVSTFVAAAWLGRAGPWAVAS